jgi:hypothetical protein
VPLSWFVVILGKVPPRKPRGTFLFRDVNRVSESPFCECTGIAWVGRVAATSRRPSGRKFSHA